MFASPVAVELGVFCSSNIIKRWFLQEGSPHFVYDVGDHRHSFTSCLAGSHHLPQRSCGLCQWGRTKAAGAFQENSGDDDMTKACSSLKATHSKLYDMIMIPVPDLSYSGLMTILTLSLLLCFNLTWTTQLNCDDFWISNAVSMSLTRNVAPKIGIGISSGWASCFPRQCFSSFQDLVIAKYHSPKANIFQTQIPSPDQIWHMAI